MIQSTFPRELPKRGIPRRTRGIRRFMRGALLGAGVSLLGCGSFNPAFLNLLDSEGTGQFATIDNAPGHVVISFINNAEVDEQLIRYLESPDGGSLILSDVDKRALRPRIRFRIRITFAGGSTMDVEFINGSSNFVDPSFDTRSDPDLNQNDLDNVVVICDVQRVEVLPTSPIEVFMPVPLQEYVQRQVTGQSGDVLPIRAQSNIRTAVSSPSGR